MPEVFRVSLIVISVLFVTVGGYYRVQSQRSGERLDRTKEGWPLLIGIRLTGLLIVGSTVSWLWNPAWLGWSSVPVPEWARWVGLGGFGCSVAWLLWMFHTLGRNLTDTVITRRNATFVDFGPYRYVRNPMYTGVLVLGLSLGLAVGTWLTPLGASVIFTLLAIRTRIEEKHLIERFGDQYRVYMGRVGRFLPKLW